MEKFHIKPIPNTPEIIFSPEENLFMISGTSAPEDVRAIYYPAIEWMQVFVGMIINGEYQKFNHQKPLIFKVELSYFNSTSAKFFYDIFLELKKVNYANVPVVVEWYYDPEDLDMMDAGMDIAQLADMEFTYISKLN